MTKREKNMQPIIETNAVTKIYTSNKYSVTAVDQASIKIYPGEFVGLVGPSGSGKTTMLAMLAALLMPTRGRVIIDQNDLNQMSEAERVDFRRDRIGFTFQANNLIPYLTVLENVELMLRLNKKYTRSTKGKALALIERLGLEERANNLPSQLSGGERQRVAIARSMIHEPILILADEPTASLDTERAYQVTRLYSELIHEDQKAGIMVTHDLRMCKYVDKIIQIEDGKIVSTLESQPEIESLISCA
jgi:putative ABC transport system ATP-binding protein